MNSLILHIPNLTKTWRLMAAIRRFAVAFLRPNRAILDAILKAIIYSPRSLVTRDIEAPSEETDLRSVSDMQISLKDLDIEIIFSRFNLLAFKLCLIYAGHLCRNSNDTHFWSIILKTKATPWKLFQENILENRSIVRCVSMLNLSTCKNRKTPAPLPSKMHQQHYEPVVHTKNQWVHNAAPWAHKFLLTLDEF